MNPRVSIIMPCYNAAAHLPQSVGSVLAQTRSDWELIIVDDSSTDGSWQALERLATTDPRIRVFHQSNAGAATARNRALLEAHGVYTAFLDADDTWAPTFLEKMAAALDAQTHAVMVYCGWQNLGLTGGRGAPFVPPDYENPAKLETLFAGCRWPIHAALTRSAAIAAAGGFNPRYTNAEDYALWLQIATVAPIARVAEVLAFYHFHSATQASANLVRAALQFFQAQQSFLGAHPDFTNKLGWALRRRLTYGALLKAGYERYWKRDLPAARAIFRHVMLAVYGSMHDWKYMLPAWLPLAWHRCLVQFKDAGKYASDQPDIHTPGER
ncbi:MAG: glycosyltransferase family 2 protein [Gallionellaceae bacterium]